MKGTESSYLGDDQIFILILRVVAEISHLEQKFPHFVSCTSHVWINIHGWGSGLKQHNKTSTGCLLRGEEFPLQAP